MKNFPNIRFQPIILWSIILLAGLIRARINFSSEMIPGINGGYYPLLVRNLLEYGSLRYPDAPFVFWIQALLTKIIQLVAALDLDGSVLLASRLFDSFIPPLAAIPVYLAGKRILKDEPEQSSMSLTAAGFSALYLAFLMVMSSEMQKNALGMLWIAAYIYTLYTIKNQHDYRRLILGGFFLILAAITHIGSFAVIFLFTVIYTATLIIKSYRSISRRTILLFLAGIAAILLISLAALVMDPDRMERVISFYLNPLRLFESPYLFILISGQQLFFGFLAHNLILINTLSLIGCLLILIRRKSLTASDYKFATSLAILSIILSSPLIGIEWALRYHLMAYLPIAFLSIFAAKTCKRTFARMVVLSVILSVTLLSAVAGVNGRRGTAISGESYNSLKELKKNMDIRPEELVIARHGLEWWTGWVLRCRTGKEYCLRPEDWEKYPRIFLLKQKAGNNYPNHSGTGQFASIPVPKNAVTVYENSHFNLYELKKPEREDYFPGELPLLQGKIMKIDDKKILVRSEGYRQWIEPVESAIYIESDYQELKPGMQVDIWGKRRPFSLTVSARKIRAYQTD